MTICKLGIAWNWNAYSKMQQKSWELVNAELMENWNGLEETEQEVAALPEGPKKEKLDNTMNNLFQGYTQLGRATLKSLREVVVKKMYEITIIKTRIRENFWFVKQVKTKRNELVRA